MNSLSIRLRLTLWYTLALAVILASFSVVLLLLAKHQLLARTDAALQEELQELVLEVRLAKNSTEFQHHLRDRFFQHDIYDFLVSDQTRRVLFFSSGLTDAQASSLVPHRPIKTIEYQSHAVLDAAQYRIASRSVEGPRGLLVVQALTPLKPFHQEVRTIELLMLTLIPLGVLLALCGGYFLADRALKPVEQIVNDASSITISDLHRRIVVSNPHDELGRLATTLNSLIARLERAVAEIQRFTADASHELRTPLAVLRAEAESALRQARSASEYKRSLEIVADEAARLGNLADQLLNLSRYDAGITVYRRENVRVDALLLDVADQLRPLAARRNIKLDFSGINCIEVLGDDVRLSQALFNVLENAIKYSQAGGLVEIEVKQDRGRAVIAFRDAGIGIPHEHLPKVFDRFYRVDESRHSATGGAGLGLAIAKTAIEAHHGQIGIESQPGLGTTVTIQLPNVIGSEPAEPLLFPLLSGTNHDGAPL